MTTTHERIAALARATEIDAEELLELVERELGHREALDDFQVYGNLLTKAVAPASILHILSGNTPEAAWQSLVRGLVLGARNFCKLPARGLPALESFVARLPTELRALVELRPEPGAWLAEAEAIIVFGNDETVAHFRGLAGPHQRFVAHGHKVSFGVIHGEFDAAIAAAAARDASLFDQQGCLSPHLFYVENEAAEFAALLAAEMKVFAGHTPRAVLAAEDAEPIMAARREAIFRAALDGSARLWASEDSTSWTVIWEADPAFRFSCLNRVVRVKPFPAEWATTLAPVRPHLGTIGFSPFTREHARALAALGASRICALGAMQEPRWLWHQDGGQNLAPLVRWIDLDLPRGTSDCQHATGEAS